MRKKTKLQRSAAEKDNKIKHMAKNPERTKEELFEKNEDNKENLHPSGQNDYPGAKSSHS